MKPSNNHPTRNRLPATRNPIPDTRYQKILAITLLFIFFHMTGHAQTILYPGDLAFTSVNADGSKSFSFFFLRDVEAGTVLHFTDNAWISDIGEYRDTEGVMTYTAPAFVEAGEIVVCPVNNDSEHFTESGSFNPSGSGDNIIAFQGSLADPFFIAGIGWARGASVWEYDEVSANSRSDVPWGLSFEEGTVVSLGTGDNYVYNGIRYQVAGVRGELLVEFGDPANFDSSNSDELFCGGERVMVQQAVLRRKGVAEGGSADVQDWDVVDWGGVPGRYSTVEVAAPVAISGDVVVHDLTIEAGGSVAVLPGARLTVKGGLVNEAGVSGILIHADESGSGALYHATEDVEGSVEVYLTPDQWHFVSAPVETSQSLSDLFADDHLYGLYEFDEPNNSWTQANLENGIRAIGHGYNVKYNTLPKTLHFAGLLNSFRSRRFYSLTKGAGGGWNLIGNPFPAPMAWCLNSKRVSLEHETIYITTGGSGEQTTWDTFNGTSGIGVPSNDVGNVAVGQGFWVQAGEDGAQIGINSYSHTYGTSRFKRFDVRGSIFEHWLFRLRLVHEDGEEQLAIGYHPLAGAGYDALDSKNMNQAGFAAMVDNKACIIATYPTPDQVRCDKFFNPTSQSPSPSVPQSPSPSVPQSLIIPLHVPYHANLELLNPDAYPEASIQLEDQLLRIEYDLKEGSVFVSPAEGGSSPAGRYRLLVRVTGEPDDILVGEKGERVKGEKVVLYYLDLVGRRYRVVPDGWEGVLIEVFEVGGQRSSQLIYYGSTSF